MLTRAVQRCMVIALGLVIVFLSLSASATETLPVCVPHEKKTKPNIVLFFIDDLGYMDLSCNGSQGYATPNIDRLAERSVQFRNFYSANPVCSPTRVALLTGKAPQRLGITQWINQPNDLHLPLSEVTIAESFQESGYQNGYIGKWHVGEKDHQMPNGQGFPWMRCVNRGGAPGSYFFPFQRKKKSGEIAYWDVPDLADRKQGDYLTDEMTDLALEFIDKKKKAPFFLCFAHYAVHTPIQAPKSLTDKYEAKFATLPKITPFLKERNGGRTRPRQDNPTYAAMIENLDTNVGRVIEHLEKQGLADNTIIVFTSDNGGLSTTGRVGPTSCQPLRAGKGWTYEGGIRIPTMIAWPEKIKPSICKVPAITMDLYPTLLELAGLPAKPNQHVDGLSLKKLINGDSDSAIEHRFLAWTYPHNHGSKHTPSNAIRKGDWKLIQKTDPQTDDDDRLELYHLGNDLSETKNLAKSNPQKANELLKLLTQWLEDTKPKN